MLPHRNLLPPARPTHTTHNTRTHNHARACAHAHLLCPNSARPSSTARSSGCRAESNGVQGCPPMSRQQPRQIWQNPARRRPRWRSHCCPGTHPPPPRRNRRLRAAHQQRLPAGSQARPGAAALLLTSAHSDQVCTTARRRALLCDTPRRFAEMTGTDLSLLLALARWRVWGGRAADPSGVQRSVQGGVPWRALPLHGPGRQLRRSARSAAGRG